MICGKPSRKKYHRYYPSKMDNYLGGVTTEIKSGNAIIERIDISCPSMFTQHPLGSFHYPLVGRECQKVTITVLLRPGTGPNYK
jgi:hypothetical protein